MAPVRLIRVRQPRARFAEKDNCFSRRLGSKRVNEPFVECVYHL